MTLGTNSKDTSTISGVCSLGKLIATFVAQQVAEAQIADEFQVFFYAFNESAGAAAGECIANFPIDLTMFYDQFSLHVQQTGTSRMSVSEFMRFVIDAQLHDPRSLGYGTRTYYKPFLKGESAAMLEDKKKREEYEDWATRNTSKYGPFHIPTIDTYLEAVPLISDAQTMVDFLSDVAVGRSAKEEFYNQQGVRRALKGKYAIRLHIYDKQLNPYKAVETAIKPPSDKPGHMVLISQNEDAVDKYRKDKDKVTAMLQKLYSGQELNQQEAALSAGVFVPMDLSTNQNVKDYISSMVPTITFGGNASTVISAQLSTNQDALLSSVQMMKQSGRTNPQSPAGAGPGGLPITVIPGQLTMTTLGCPMAQLTQKYFVDFNTGTTADNIYCVNKLSHTFSPGKFETSWTFVWADAYGRIAGGGDLKDYLKFLSKSLQTPSTDNKGKKSNKSKDKKNSQ